MTELSPAAQAILAAWCDAHGWENEDIPPAVFHGLAAALRALADTLPDPWPDEDFDFREGWQEAVSKIEIIAIELENHD